MEKDILNYSPTVMFRGTLCKYLLLANLILGRGNTPLLANVLMNYKTERERERGGEPVLDAALGL